PYYFRLPERGDPLARRHWTAFARQRAANLAALEAYKLSAGVPNEVQRLFHHEQQPYVYAELGPAGETLVFQFDPSELLAGKRALPPEKRAQLKRLFTVEPDRAQIVFPVFPTVYSAGNEAHQLED